MEQQEYFNLVRKAQEAEHAYYVLAKPIMPDTEFDSLMQKLAAHEKVHTADPSSPTQRVGSDLASEFAKAEHVVPALSIDNIFSMDDLEARLKKMLEELEGYPIGSELWAVEPKIDGLSLDLRYENGILVRAITRGDGRFGDVVTENARTIRSVPLNLNANPKHLDVPSIVHIRGEVFMTFKDFGAVNAVRKERLLEPLANPRNGAAGALKLLDSAECAARRLTFLPYQLAVASNDAVIPANQATLWSWLKDLGFRPFGDGEAETFDNTDDLLNWVARFEAFKKNMPYPTDGAVVKLSYAPARLVLGAGEKWVRWAYAFKYSPSIAETRLNGITIQIGRSGVLTPVAELEPVEISGSTVRRASLHNQDQIIKLRLSVGDRVQIQKHGEIIPGVISVAAKSFVCTGCGFQGALEQQQQHHGHPYR